MALLSVRTRSAVSKVAFAGLIAAAASASARADLSRTLPHVPRFKLFASSHATAAAEVIAYWAARSAADIGQEALRLGSGSTSSRPTIWATKKGLPEVVLIGGLEGRIYRCDCGKDIGSLEQS